MAEIEYFEKEKDTTAVGAEGSAAEVSAEDKKEMYVPGLVLGILSLVLSFGLLGTILGLIGLILSIGKKGKNKITVPVILNAIGIVVSVCSTTYILITKF